MKAVFIFGKDNNKKVTSQSINIRVYHSNFDFRRSLKMDISREGWDFKSNTIIDLSKGSRTFEESQYLQELKNTLNSVEQNFSQEFLKLKLSHKLKSFTNETWKEWCAIAQEELRSATGTEIKVPMELPTRDRLIAEAFPGKRAKRLTPSVGIRWLIDRAKEVEVLCQMRLAHQTDRAQENMASAGASSITNSHQTAESPKHWNKASEMKGGSNVKEDAEACLKDSKEAFRKAAKHRFDRISMRQRVALLKDHMAKLRGHLDKMIRSEWAVQTHTRLFRIPERSLKGRGQSRPHADKDSTQFRTATRATQFPRGSHH